MASALSNFIISFKKQNLFEIHQKYLERGHAQMECDSVRVECRVECWTHSKWNVSSIESRSRNLEVYTPLEWETIIKSSRTSHPYEVVPLTYTFWKKFIINIPSIHPGRHMGDPVVTDIRHLVYHKNGDFEYSLSHDVGMYQCVLFLYELIEQASQCRIRNTRIHFPLHFTNYVISKICAK